MTALATFFTRRAEVEGHYCPACGSRGLDASDMALTGSRLWHAADIAAASARYGVPICNGCMDDHVRTEDGAFVHRDNAMVDACGQFWADESALWAADADAAADADLMRLAAGWR